MQSIRLPLSGEPLSEAKLRGSFAYKMIIFYYPSVKIKDFARSPDKGSLMPKYLNGGI